MPDICLEVPDFLELSAPVALGYRSTLSQDLDLSSAHLPADGGAENSTHVSAIKGADRGGIPTHEEIKAQLKQGIVPDYLSEQWRILPLDSKEGKEFQHEMSRLLKRLIPEWDPLIKPVRFSIADETSFNAFQIRGAEPPLICFNKGCFRPTGSNSLDLIAAILLHEGVHRLVEEKYGDVEDGKLEEGAADIIPVERLYDAGFDPRVARAEFERRTRAQLYGCETKLGTIVSVLDPHPTNASRVSAFDARLTQLFLARGDIEREPTDLTKKTPLVRIAAKAHYASPFERYMGAKGTKNLDINAQLEALTAYVRYTAYIPESTGAEIARHIIILTRDGVCADTGKIDKLADALFDRCLDGFVAGCKEIYGALCWLAAGAGKKECSWLLSCFDNEGSIKPSYGELLPLGRLKKIESAARRFIDGAQAHEIFQSAKDLNSAVAAEPMVKVQNRGVIFGEQLGTERIIIKNVDRLDGISAFFRSIRWPRFTVEATLKDNYGKCSPITPPWDPHLKLTRSMDSEGRAELAEALAITGITEARVIELFSQETALEYVCGRLPLFGVGPRVTLTLNGRQLPESANNTVRIDEKGRICAIDDVAQTSSLDGFTNDSKTYEVELKIIDPAMELLLSKLQPGKSDEILEQQIINLSKRRERVSSLARWQHDYEPPPVLGLQNAHANWRVFMGANERALQTTGGQAALSNYFTNLALSDSSRCRSELLDLFSVLRSDSEKRPQFQLYPITLTGSGDLDPLRSAAPGESPMLSFILKAVPQLLSSSEKLEILGELINWESIEDTVSLGRFWQRHSMEKHRTELVREARPIIRDLIPEYPAQGISTWRTLQELLAAGRIPANLCMQHLVHLEAQAVSSSKNFFLRKAPSSECAELLLNFLPASMLKNEHDPVLAALRKTVRTLSWPEDISKQVLLWGLFHDRNILEPKQAHKILVRLLERIDSSHAEAEQIRNFEELLARSASRIADPKLRNIIITKWAAAVAKVDGIDDCSQPFHDKLIQRIRAVQSRAFPLDRVDILNALASAVKAQHKLAITIGEECRAVTQEQLQSISDGTVFGELVVNQLRYGATFRRELIRFLINPVSESAAEKMIKKTYKWGAGRVGFQVGRPADVLARRIEREKLVFFHQNFWELPLELKVGLLRELVIPPLPDEELTAYNFVLDLMFPEKQKENKYPRARARSFITGLPVYVKPFALSALTTAARKTAQGSHSLGSSLAALIEGMGGPAEYKTGQAAQGHPQTPQDIREALAPIKTKAAPPTRWNLLKMLEDRVPLDVRSKITRVGELLGSGSLYVAVGVEWENGEERVLLLLRPYAYERGKSGFRYLRHALEGRDSNDPISLVLREQFDAAERFLEIESCAQRALEVNARALSVYDRTYVAVDKTTTFGFVPPKVLEAGEGFVVLERAGGENVIELAQATRPEFEYKRKVSKAIVAAELKGLLSGDYVDNDRHGGNSRVAGTVIAPIDLWGLLQERPSAPELEVFNTALARAIAQSVSFGGFQMKFSENLRASLQSAAEVPSFFVHAQKALLALAEYTNVMSSTDWIDAFAAALKAAPIEVSKLYERELEKTWSGKLMLSKIARSPCVIYRGAEQLH